MQIGFHPLPTMQHLQVKKLLRPKEDRICASFAEVINNKVA